MPTESGQDDRQKEHQSGRPMVRHDVLLGWFDSKTMHLLHRQGWEEGGSS